MTASERKLREKEALRRRILDSARALFVAFGYEGVTMRRIAESVEYALGTLYLHFRDKDEIIRALCREDWEEFEQSFPRGEQPVDPVEALRWLGSGYISFALSHPNQYRLMFMTPNAVQPDADMLEKQGDPTHDGYALLKATAQAAIDAGRLRPAYRDAELVAQTLWAGVHGMASLEIIKGHDPWVNWAPVRERTDAMLDGLMLGLAISPAPGKAKRK